MSKKPAKPAPIGHNNPPPASFVDVLKTLAVDLPALKANALNAGKETASGHDSILSLGLRVYASAKHAGLASGDVAQVYAEYCKGQNSTQYGAKIDVENAASMKAGRSKLMCFHKLANVAGDREYVSVIPQTIALINGKALAEGKAKGGSLYEKVLKVVRTVVKAGDRPLPSNVELINLLFPVREDKTIIDKLNSIDETCQTLIDKPENIGFSWYLANIQNTVREQIKAIGVVFEEQRKAALEEGEGEGDEPNEDGADNDDGADDEPSEDPLATFLQAAE